MRRLDLSRPQPGFGLIAGGIIAVLLLAVLGLARLAGADDSTLPAGISVREQVLLYLAAGVAGGLLFGLLIPLSQRAWSSAILGMISVTPYFLGQWWLAGDQTGPYALMGAGVVIVVLGGVVGYWTHTRLPVDEQGGSGRRE